MVKRASLLHLTELGIFLSCMQVNALSTEDLRDLFTLHENIR
jgi:hypothetical protein